MKNTVFRKCRGCSNLKDRNELIKVTLCDDKLHINPDSKTVGRSVYICKNSDCIKTVIKYKGIKKALKFNNDNEIKRVEACLSELSF